MMKSMLSVAAAILVLAACTNDHEPGYAPAKEIRVDASIGQMTRVNDPCDNRRRRIGV